MLQKSLEKQGIAIHVGSRVERAEVTANGVQVQMHTPEGARTVQGTDVLVAIRVQGNIENLGLDTGLAYTVSVGLSPLMRTAV